MPANKTVLLTGASGYIGKHIALKLLDAGYNVVGSVRSLSRGDEVRAAVQPNLLDKTNLDKRLTFVALDLGKDDGWDAAMTGIDVLMHTASPFPLSEPKHEDELIRPAVDGTLRALRAAHRAGIRRVVLTSSFAAVMGAKLSEGRKVFDESDWTDPTSPTIGAYIKSKTLAEMAAWDFIRDEAPDMALTTINPTFVMGAPLDENFGGSVEVIQRFLRGTDPMMPRYGLGCVDVRDIAEMHVRCLGVPESEGKRILGAERFLWFQEVGQILKSQNPDYKIPTRQAPDFLIRILAIFDKSLKSLVPDLGVRFDVDNSRARNMLGVEFTSANESLQSTADYLVKNNLID